MTKLSCTLLVNQLACDRFRDVNAVNTGIIVVAEYHVVNDRTSAVLVITRTNQRFDNTFNNKYIFQKWIFFGSQFLTVIHQIALRDNNHKNHVAPTD